MLIHIYWTIRIRFRIPASKFYDPKSLQVNPHPPCAHFFTLFRRPLAISVEQDANVHLYSRASAPRHCSAWVQPLFQGFSPSDCSAWVHKVALATHNSLFSGNQQPCPWLYYMLITPPLEALVTSLEYLDSQPVLILGSKGFKL